MSEIAIIIKRRLLAFMLALCDNEKFEGKLNPDERAKRNEFFLIQCGTVYKVLFALNLTNYIWHFKNVSQIEFKTLFGSSFDFILYRIEGKLNPDERAKRNESFLIQCGTVYKV